MMVQYTLNAITTCFVLQGTNNTDFHLSGVTIDIDDLGKIVFEISSENYAILASCAHAACGYLILFTIRMSGTYRYSK